MFQMHCSEETSSVRKTDTEIEESVCKTKKQRHEGNNTNAVSIKLTDKQRKGRFLTQVSCCQTD